MAFEAERPVDLGDLQYSTYRSKFDTFCKRFEESNSLGKRNKYRRVNEPARIILFLSQAGDILQENWQNEKRAYARSSISR